MLDDARSTKLPMAAYKTVLSLPWHKTIFKRKRSFLLYLEPFRPRSLIDAFKSMRFMTFAKFLYMFPIISLAEADDALFYPKSMLMLKLYLISHPYHIKLRFYYYIEFEFLETCSSSHSETLSWWRSNIISQWLGSVDLQTFTIPLSG